MIVLRITVDGRSWNVQQTAPRVLLGTAAEAQVREDGVGWRPAEAVLHHLGTEILLERPHEGTQLRLRVGDGIRLGRARVTLVGLLPLAAAEGSPDAPAPVFGGYEDDLAAGGTGFDLAPPGGPPPGVDARTAPSPPPTGASTPPPRAAAPPRPASPTRGVIPAPRPPAPAFRRGDFGSELVGQIRRAPFFVLSIALHALVFFLLAVIQTHEDTGEANRHGGTLLAALHPPTEEAAMREEEEDLGGEDFETPTFPELPEPDLPDPLDLTASGQPDPDENLRLDPLPPPPPRPAPSSV